MGVICVLPARLSSTRIPRKPLQAVAGRPLLEWAWRAACRVPGVDRVVIATEAEEVRSVARAFGADVVMTRSSHRTGTERVEETASRLGAREDDVIVNFQADEPFVDPATVSSAVGLAGASEEAGRADIVTLAAPIRDLEEWRSPGVVEVVRARDGRALYFSRAGVPHPREGGPELTAGSPFLRHVGIYACRRVTLRRWAELPESPLESVERLEQLRALEHGLRIDVAVGPATEPGIDLPADLERAERVLSTG